MKTHRLEKIFIFFISALLGLLFFYSPGTGDVIEFVREIKTFPEVGLVEGWAIGFAYPPLCSTILWVFHKIGFLLGLDDFASFKLSVFVGWLGFSGFVFVLTRKFRLLMFAMAASFLVSVLQGYVDIFVFPFLFLSFYLLGEYERSKSKWILEAALLSFSISTMVKFQPLILAPFYLVYFIRVCSENSKRNWRERLLFVFHTLRGSVLFYIIIFSIFGLPKILGQLHYLMGLRNLSGYALNLPWIFTRVLKEILPQQFGAIAPGEWTGRLPLGITGMHLTVYDFQKKVFWVSYLIWFYKFLKNSKSSVKSLMSFCLGGFLVYFTINLSVHEEHLCLVFPMALYLMYCSKDFLKIAIFWVLLWNINMLYYGGFYGRGVALERIHLDLSIVWAVLEVIFFIYTLRFILKWNKEHQLTT